MPHHASLITTSFLLLALLTQPATADDTYQVVIEEGKHADIVRPDGDPVLRYMYGYDDSSRDRAFDTAKVFAHVMAPGGQETITKGAGGKYPHHRGIFIGWNRIEHEGQRHDLWHVRNTVQKHEKFLKTRADQHGATITTHIVWIGNRDKPLIEEERTHRVIQSPDAYAVIDFVSTLTATAGDLKLGGDPEHAGVQFRASQKVAENGSATYTFHQAGVDPKQQRDLPWVANTFRIEDQTWTVQQMSHPSNPAGAIWSAYRDYGRFGAFPVIELDQVESVTLRFRFRITRGEAPAREEMTQQYQQFVE